MIDNVALSELGVDSCSKTTPNGQACGVDVRLGFTDEIKTGFGWRFQLVV